MELILRAAIIYLFLLLILRISGKRQFSEITTFDFVLLLIISEAVSQGLYGSADYSLTASLLIVITLVALDVVLSFLKHWLRWFDDFLESKPTMLVQDGRLLQSNLARERIDESDILASARQIFGLESLSEVRHAILERDGSISIIPRSQLWTSRTPQAGDENA
jgi:uncharacterized membrane protein YcaP (DUF421 family)